MDETDKIELKNGIDDTDEIKLKNCTVKGKVVDCDMEREEYKKMEEVPDDLTINVVDEVPKNKSIDETKPIEETKSIDETKPTEADSSNNQGCECSKTTESSKIANFVAKYQLNKEN